MRVAISDPAGKTSSGPTATIWWDKTRGSWWSTSKTRSPRARSARDGFAPGPAFCKLQARPQAAILGRA